MSTIKDGPHWLSGVDEFRFTDEYGTDMDGYAIIVDGETYLAYEDRDDGYRSYGILRQIDGNNIAVINQFEPQYVFAETLWVESDDEFECKDVFRIKNEYGQVIIEVSTNRWDNYYPVGHVEYRPENLPCNTKQKPS